MPDMTMDPQMLLKLLTQQGQQGIMPPKSPGFNNMQMKPMMGGSPGTPGPGMGRGAAPTMPGAGQIPPDQMGKAEGPQGVTDPSLLRAAASQFPAQSAGPMIPPGGQNIPGLKEMVGSELKATAGNDPINPLASKLMEMKGPQMSNQDKFNSALQQQKAQANGPMPFGTAMKTPPQQPGSPTGLNETVPLETNAFTGMVQPEHVEKAKQALLMQRETTKDAGVKRAINAQLTSISAYPQMQQGHQERIKDFKAFEEAAQSGDLTPYVSSMADRYINGPGKSELAIANYQRQKEGKPPVSLDVIKQGAMEKLQKTIEEKGVLNFQKELHTDVNSSQKHLDNTTRTIRQLADLED